MPHHTGGCEPMFDTVLQDDDIGGMPETVKAWTDWSETSLPVHDKARNLEGSWL